MKLKKILVVATAALAIVQLIACKDEVKSEAPAVAPGTASAPVAAVELAAVPTPVTAATPKLKPNLNVALDDWVAKMNVELKSSKLPALAISTDMHNCTDWCSDMYKSSQHMGYLVTHQDNRINEIVAIGSGDGTAMSGVDMTLGYAALTQVLSPKEVTETRGKKLFKIIGGAMDGKENNTMVIDGIRYRMVQVDGMGLMMSAYRL
ncbi:MAG: hypothetical protein Q7K57_12850 [Burkholderiaceae bacterium]|nr:hypothetical protein [Burkholderiaceae bacterium]